MGGSVSTLVVSVQGNVEAEVLGHVLIVSVAKHVGVVAWSRPSVGEMYRFIKTLTNKVKVLLDTREFLSGLIDISVDPGGQSGKLSQQVDGILIGIGPVFSLLDTLLIRGSEGTVVIESGDGHSELSHGVQGLREATKISALYDARVDDQWEDTRINEFLDKLGKFSTFRELIRERADLFWGRHLPGEQEPEHALRDNLLAIDSGGELFLAIWNGQSVEAYTLVADVRNRLRTAWDMHEPRLGQGQSLPREGP